MRLTPLLLLFILTGCAINPGVQREQIEGRPADLNFTVGERTDAPLIIALHGSSGNSVQFQAQSDIIGEAAAAGYRLALLNGQKWNARTYYGEMRSWNAGACCWDRPADDVAYLTRAIAALQVGATGEGRKVVVVGHSNGSMMAYALMCARPDLLTGVVGVSGTVAITDCQPSATRIIHIHGDSDGTVPLSGDPDLSDGRNFYSLAYQDRLFRSAGIQQRTFIVEGASHELADVNVKLREQSNISISQLVLSLLK